MDMSLKKYLEKPYAGPITFKKQCIVFVLEQIYLHVLYNNISNKILS